MIPNRPRTTVHGVHAPAARLTWQAALLLATGLSSAFLVVLAGFALALALVRPGWAAADAPASGSARGNPAAALRADGVAEIRDGARGDGAAMIRHDPAPARGHGAIQSSRGAEPRPAVFAPGWQWSLQKA